MSSKLTKKEAKIVLLHHNAVLTGYRFLVHLARLAKAEKADGLVRIPREEASDE